MFELIYCSRARKDISRKDISDILETSRAFNAEFEITGCLLYYKDEFIQILEGDEQVVKALYARIKKDKRHFNVFLLAEQTVEERAFNNWSMAFHEPAEDEVNNISQELFVNNFITFSELANKPTNAVKLFWYKAMQILGK